MAKNANERQTFPANHIRLCIDEYNGDIKGRIYNIMNEEAIEFDNCCEMLMKTDALFERVGYPQSFCEERSFLTKKKEKCHYDLPGKALIKDEELEKQSGKLCTLDALIRSRRQASWQGIIKADKDSRLHEFDCGMELLRYIEKVITSPQDTEQNWERKIKIKTYATYIVINHTQKGRIKHR